MRFIFTCLLAFTTVAVAQRYKTPQSYLTFIDSQNATVVQQTWDYMTVYTNNPKDPATKGQLKVLENTLLKSLRSIEKDNPFDEQLQQDAITYLRGNLAIVQGDYKNLLETKLTIELLVDNYTTYKQIRAKMLNIRTVYDQAVRNYGSRHKLNIVANTSLLAQRMEKTIALYDHYNEVRALIKKLQQADAALWENLPQETPAVFLKNLESFKTVAASNASTLKSLQGFNNDPSYHEEVLAAQNDLLTALNTNQTAIVSILTAYETGDNTNLEEKTKAFNDAKTVLNLSRHKLFKDSIKTGQLYLQKHLNGF